VKQILDHGYVKLIETWGSDERIVESARMSTGKGFNGWGAQCVDCGGDGYYKGPRLGDEPCPKCNGNGSVGGDEKLLRFLYENHHSTPFEMAGATFEIKAPIFVFREWHRHRTQSYNEMSARYTPLPDENYMPTVERLMLGSDGKNKQAGTVSGAEVLSLDSALEWLAELASVYEHSERVYQSGLRRGVPKELARLPIPVARYSRMRASCNLRNWLGFGMLRSTDKNPAAQWEIRQFGDTVLEMLRKPFSRTLALFDGVSR